MHKLMIVDDSNIIRKKVAQCEGDGLFEVVATAGDGYEAIEQFKKHKPDMVTMDITMPRMEGLDCIKELMDINPDVRILVISALSDQDTGLDALELGARGFLCKPFSDEELIEALTELMETA